MDPPQNYQNKPKVCTDKLWLYLFIPCLCVLIVITTFSIVYGNYAAVINGADSYGNICNQKHNKHFENFNLSATDTSKKPFLFYFDFMKYNGVVRICVEKCPNQRLLGVDDLINFYNEFGSQLCAYDIDIPKQNVTPNYERLKGRRGPCPIITRKTKPYRNRCIYVAESYLVDDVYNDVLNSGGLDQLFFVAVYQAWYYIAFMCAFAFVISLILLAMMSWFSKSIAWIICLLTIITNAALTTQLWLLYDFSPIIDEDEENNKIIEFDEMLKKDYQIILNLLEEFRVNNFIIICLAILTSLITIILITITLIMRKHLSQLKLLFEESVTCIKQLSGIGVVLNIALLSMILLILLSGFTLLCITTAKYPMLVPTMEKFYIDDIDPMQNLRLFYQIEYVDSKTIRSTLWIYIIGFLWTTEFIFAFEEFCIGAAVAFWYFKPSVYKPSQHALEVLLKYHLGTIVNGSAVITLFKVPRLLLIFISKIIRKIVNQVWFQRLKNFEERIGLWNHNAYAPAAMETIDYQSAGKVAWNIFSKNAEQVESINNVFDFILFLSKLLVATLTCLIGIIILKNRRDYLIVKDKDEFFFYIAPVLFGTFCAFCIAHIVFSIIEMTVDTLLLCVCEDHLIFGGLRCSMIKCNLGKLFKKNNEENDIHVIKVNKIQKQPFQA